MPEGPFTLYIIEQTKILNLRNFLGGEKENCCSSNLTVKRTLPLPAGKWHKTAQARGGLIMAYCKHSFPSSVGLGTAYVGIVVAAEFDSGEDVFPRQGKKTGAPSSLRWYRGFETPAETLCVSSTLRLIQQQQININISEKLEKETSGHWRRLSEGLKRNRGKSAFSSSEALQQKSKIVLWFVDVKESQGLESRLWTFATCGSKTPHRAQMIVQ